MAVTGSRELLEVYERAVPMIQLHSCRKYFPQKSQAKTDNDFTKHLPSIIIGGTELIGKSVPNLSCSVAPRFKSMGGSIHFG